MLDDAVRERFERSFVMYRDLVDAVGADGLAQRLGDLRSNTIGAQLWCVVGARESYSRAIEAGAWSGFTCSLDDTLDPARVQVVLAASEDAVRAALAGIDGSDLTRWGFALDLLEHEAAHHGQLIRYLYGLDLPIPETWKRRYALN
jgi:hypothetical protein